MATLTLNDVVQQLQVNKRATDDVVKTLRDWIQLSKDNMLQELENEREKKRQKKKDTKEAQAPGGSPRKAKGGFNFSFAGIIKNLKAGLLTVVAGAVAFAGLAAGLGGWELKAIEKIKLGLSGPEGVGAKVSQGFANMRAAINTAVTNRMTAIKTGFLSFLGYDADGKPKTGMEFDADGKLKLKSGPGGISAAIRTMTFQIGRILKPIITVGSAIGAWFGGKTGMAIAKFSRTFLMAGGAKFIGLVSKILWPLSIILGAYDLITGFIETEGNVFDKAEGGIKKMVRNMLGVPLDLIKMGITWVLKKIFPGQVGEDGKFNPDGGLGRYLSMFENFSIAEKIDNMIGFIFDVPRNAIEWIGTLFSDPKEALTQLWTRLLPTLGEGIGSFVDILFLPARLLIDWISRKLGWREDDAPLFSFKTFVKDTFGRIIDWFRKIPDRIMLSLREISTLAIAGAKLDFMDLVDMIKNFPARVKLYVKSLMPNWFNMGMSDAEYKSALAKINAPDEARMAERQAIIAQVQKELADIERQRQALNAPTVVGGDTTNTTNINLSDQRNIRVIDPG